MKASLLLYLFLIFTTGAAGWGQESPSEIAPHDTSPAAAPGQQSLPTDSNPPPDAPPTPPPKGDPNISWKRMTLDLVNDQKRIYSFPVQVVRGKYWHGTHWVPLVAVLGTTAALVPADAPISRAFSKTDAFSGFNRVFSGNNTALAILATPLALYATGLMRRDSYAQHTALLAGEAVADSEILTTILKDLDRRLRPADVPLHGNLSDTWFDGTIGGVGGNGSFPSGHTIAAFSVATVISERYRNHRWVPYIAYGAAGVIGFSRLSLLSHFPSDVFMGAALGYSIPHFIVLRK